MARRPYAGDPWARLADHGVGDGRPDWAALQALAAARGWHVRVEEAEPEGGLRPKRRFRAQAWSGGGTSDHPRLASARANGATEEEALARALLSLLEGESVRGQAGPG